MKRSIWITFFSLSLIVFALYWVGFAMVIILGAQLPTPVSDIVAGYLVLLAFFYAFAGISAAMRKIWARRLVIALSILGIFTIALLAPFLHKGVSAEAGIYKDGKYYRLSEERVKGTSSFLEAIAQAVIMGLGKELERMGMMFGNIILGAIEAASLLYLTLILFIFTRLKT